MRLELSQRDHRGEGGVFLIFAPGRTGLFAKGRGCWRVLKGEGQGMFGVGRKGLSGLRAPSNHTPARRRSKHPKQHALGLVHAKVDGEDLFYSPFRHRVSNQHRIRHHFVLSAKVYLHRSS